MKKDKNIKTFSLTEEMIGSLMFAFRPFKERQMEMMYWSEQLREIENEIVKSLGVDQTNWSCDWTNAYKTGKLICTRINKENKNGENKKE